MLQRRIGTIWTSSGCSVSRRPRRNWRPARTLRVVVAVNEGISGRGIPPILLPNRRRAGLRHCTAHAHRTVEDLADGNEAPELVAADCFEARRSEAAAVGAIGVPTELARRDPLLEIRCKTLRRPGEDAFRRRRGRSLVHLQHTFDHLQLPIFEPELAQLAHDARAIVACQPLRGYLADLRRI